METLVGFAIGFLVGTREGREGLAKVMNAVEGIMASPDVKHFVGEAMTIAAPAMRELARATGGGRA